MLAIYCRTSKTKKKGEDQSIPSQKEEGVKFAISKGWTYKFFIDEGISGTKDDIEERPSFADMISEINKGKFDAVYCFDQSRIERNSGVWNLFVGYMLSNECEYYPAGKKFDLNDPHNILIATIISATNQFYAALTSRKVRLANDRKVKEGKTHGMTPYGYTRSDKGFYEIVPFEAEIIQRIFKESLKGIGTYTIANGLNNDEIPTKFNTFEGDIVRKDLYTKQETRFEKKNVLWRGNVIHDMIINPIYKGERRWKDVEAAKVPAIIDSELWDKVNSNLVNNRKNVGKKEEYHYLLNGIIFCEDCGMEFRGKKRLKGNDNSYKCKGVRPPHKTCKNSRGISLPKLETFIIKHLFESKELKEALTNAPVESAQYDNLKQKLETLQGKEKELNRRKERAYNLLLDEDFTDDSQLKADLFKTKRLLEHVQKNIEITEQNIYERENNVRNQRASNLINDFSLNQPFEAVKQAVHLLVEKITIKHIPFDKGGAFTVGIKYRNYEEHSNFVTDWNALNWKWVTFQRSAAFNEEQRNEDEENLMGLFDFYNIENNSIPDLIDAINKEDIMYPEAKENLINSLKNGNGFKVSILMNQTITLNRKELIDFE